MADPTSTPAAPFGASAAAPSAAGLTRPSGRFEPTTFLSDVISALGLADDERLEAALQSARNPGHTLEGVLLESAVLSEEALARALSERYDVELIDLGAFPADPSAETAIEPEVARCCDALPVAYADDRTLLVAMADPADWLAADEIRRRTGLRVKPAVATATAVRAAIDAAAARTREEARGGVPAGDSSPADGSSRAELAAAGSSRAEAPPSAEASVAAGPPPAAALPSAESESRLEAWPDLSPAAPDTASDGRYGDLERRLAERAARLECERDQLERERAELRAARRLDRLVPAPT